MKLDVTQSICSMDYLVGCSHDDQTGKSFIPFEVLVIPCLRAPPSHKSKTGAKNGLDRADRMRQAIPRDWDVIIS